MFFITVRGYLNGPYQFIDDNGEIYHLVNDSKIGNRIVRGYALMWPVDLESGSTVEILSPAYHYTYYLSKFIQCGDFNNR